MSLKENPRVVRFDTFFIRAQYIEATHDWTTAYFFFVFTQFKYQILFCIFNGAGIKIHVFSMFKFVRFNPVYMSGVIFFIILNMTCIVSTKPFLFLVVFLLVSVCIY